MLELPKPGYASRIRIYFAEMFPVPTRLVASVLLYASIVIFMRRITGVRAPVTPLFTFVGIWSLFAITLMVRLMDELKDKEIDCQLFSDRPVPSKRVLESDIRFSLAAVICLYLAANIWVGRALWAALFVLGYSMLMFKHFFIPPVLRENLLLTLVTHNLYVPVVYIYVVALFLIENELPVRDLRWPYVLLLITMYWTMSFAWEIARKIRSPEEENAYMTYSRLFGPLGAVLLAGAAQTVAFAIGLYFYWTFSLSSLFLGLLAAGYATPIWGYARFLFKPSPATSNLRPLAEVFVLCVLIAQSLEFGLLFGRR